MDLVVIQRKTELILKYKSIVYCYNSLKRALTNYISSDLEPQIGSRKGRGWEGAEV